MATANKQLNMDMGKMGKSIADHLRAFQARQKKKHVKVLFGRTQSDVNDLEMWEREEKERLSALSKVQR